MRSIGKLTLVLAVVGLLTTPALAGHGSGYDGGKVYWTRVADYSWGNGGEFTIYSDGAPGLLLSNVAYATTTKAQDGRSESFQSFCVELEEYVVQPMDIWVSTAWADDSDKPQWDSGNDHFPQSHSWKGGEDAGDDLDPETAYLYYHFAKGNLSNYNYATPGRATSAGILQKAIWLIEGEIGALNTNEGGFMLDAGQQAQAAAWIAEADWTDIGPVRVLQMYGSIENRQDQLWLIPAPGAVLLGALGLAMAGWVKRRVT